MAGLNRHAPIGVRVAAVVLLATLSACAPQTTDLPPAGTQASPASEKRPAITSLPSLNAPTMTAANGEAAPALGPSADLVGIDREEMQRLFGPPVLRRQEGEAEVWQYPADRCVMDAYLYAQAASEAPHRVAYVEFREGGLGILPEGTARERCYAEVLVERQRRVVR